MAITACKQTVYLATDGSKFVNKKEAEQYEFRYKIRQWADDRGIGSGGEWSQDMICNEMIDSVKDLKAIFSELS